MDPHAAQGLVPVVFK